MRIADTQLNGAKLIDLEPVSDDRGSFARTFCAREFAANGLETNFLQHSVSRNKSKGTLRGMHFQIGADAEVKVVSCTRGAIYDVIVDLRGGDTHGRWQGFELTADNRRRLYIPKGFAHGFQTLTDDAEVSYLISAFYAPEAARGVRYDDPAFDIRWPLPVSATSDRDKAWPNYRVPA